MTARSAAGISAAILLLEGCSGAKPLSSAELQRIAALCGAKGAHLLNTGSTSSVGYFAPGNQVATGAVDRCMRKQLAPYSVAFEVQESDASEIVENSN